MAIDSSTVARVVGVNTVFKDLRKGGVLFLPQRIAVLAQGASAVVYPTTKFQATSSAQVGAKLGYGSPAHIIAKQLFPANGDGVGTIPVTFYPLLDNASGVPAVGSIAPLGTQLSAGQYYVLVGNIRSEIFVVTASMTMAALCTAMAAAINAVLDMPVIAAVLTGPDRVTLTTKWEGLSANGIYTEVVGDALGVTFTVTQAVGGLANPTVDAALAQIGNVWESLILNALNISDVTALNTIQTVGEGRWGELVRKPFICFTGNTIASQSSATAVSAARRTDRINAQLVSPGSRDLPFVVAARQLVRIAKMANDNPPSDYGSQPATGLIPGLDSEQWDFPTRDAAVKLGSSTVEVRDGVVCLSDIVTFYRPTGEEPPAYRYVVDIIKLMTVIFNLDLIFAHPDWDGAPLIPDDQPTVNPRARQPKTAVAQANAMIDSLGLNAIISDPKTAKKSTRGVINAQNPKRLDLETTVQLSGNSNIKGITLNFGFFYPVQVAA